jgi:hypothetical protein
MPKRYSAEIPFSPQLPAGCACVPSHDQYGMPHAEHSFFIQPILSNIPEFSLHIQLFGFFY